MTNKYLSLIFVSAKRSFANKTELIGMSLLLMIVLFAYNRLWTAISNENASAAININFIWYLLLGELIILSTPRIERVIEDDIKSGTMSYYLNKPISFFFMRFWENASSMWVAFTFMLVIGGTFALVITGGVPFTWYHFPIIALNTLLSSTINLALYTAIGFCALWLQDIRGVAMAVQRLAFIFGGAIIPLTIYPEWFVDIAKWTPFYSLYYLSIRLIYDFSWNNLAEALMLNLFWTAVLGTFLGFAYNKLAKKVEVNGG